jgi:ADP-ribosylglycohydrolase
VANDTSLLDRYGGTMLGLACGDAVGCAVEFYSRGRFQPLTDMVGGGKFRLNPGEWSDDTSMAICLASSLIKCQGHNPSDQMSRYSSWFSTGDPGAKDKPVGVGKTVMQSLFKFRRDGDPYAGSSNPRTAGNGALMRLAPVVLAYYPDREKVQEYARLSTITTHAADECIATSSLLAEAIFIALSGGNKDEIKSIHDDWQNLATFPPESVQGTGFAPESLRAAMWAFLSTKSFEEAILAAVNLGDDADTTAAICGQVAGAFYGVGAIPEHWLRRLYREADLHHLADELCELLTTNL